MTIHHLKIAESTLLKLLFDFKMKLWESQLTDYEKQEIEIRLDFLEKITFETFKTKYMNWDKPKNQVGNI